MNYEEIITDPNNLYDALCNSIEESKWKERSQKASLSFLDRIFSLRQRLLDRTYHSGNEVHFVLYERGKERPITSLDVDDRIVRHALCDYIFMPKIRNKIIYDNGASIEGRGLAFTKKRFDTHLRKYFNKYGSNNGFILFSDIQKFYDNINHDIAKNMLLDLVEHDEFISWLLDLIFEQFEIDVTGKSEQEIYDIEYGVFNKLTYKNYNDGPKQRTVKKSINIGDQLAQVIGVYYPHRVDNYIKTVLGEKYYARYMDDWYIMHNSKEHLTDILDSINEQYLELGLHINFNKTRIIPMTDQFVFLQTKYNLTETGKIIHRINPKRIIAMRRRIKKLYEKVYNGDLPIEAVDGMFRSWSGNFHRFMSHDQIINLFELYEDLFDAKLIIRKNKLVIERN